MKCPLHLVTFDPSAYSSRSNRCPLENLFHYWTVFNRVSSGVASQGTPRPWMMKLKMLDDIYKWINHWLQEERKGERKCLQVKWQVYASTKWVKMTRQMKKTGIKWTAHLWRRKSKLYSLSDANISLKLNKLDHFLSLLCMSVTSAWNGEGMSHFNLQFKWNKNHLSSRCSLCLQKVSSWG